MIKKIVMNNFKMTDTTVLSGKDIFCGSTGVGKSTRIQALMFAIYGYIPGISNNLTDIYQEYAKDKEKSLCVGIETETFQLERIIEKKITNSRKSGENKIDYKIAINISPSSGEKTIADKEARIKAEVGNLPVMLDFDKFTVMTDTEKREFIFSLCGAATSITKEQVIDYLKNKLEIDEIRNENINLFNAYMELLNFIESKYKNISIDSVIKDITDKRTYWKQEKTNLEGSINITAEQKATSGCSTQSIAENKNNLCKLREQLIIIEKNITSEEEKKKQYENISNKIKSLEQFLSQLQTTNQNIEDIQQQINKLQKNIKTIDYSEQYIQNANTVQQLKEQIKNNRNEFEKVKDEGLTIKGQIDSANKILGIIKVQNHVCVLDSRIKCQKDFKAFIDEENKEISNMINKREELIKKYKILYKTIKDNEESLQIAEDEYKKLTRDENDTNKQNSEYQKAINLMQKKISDIEKEESKMQTSKKEIESLKKEIQSIKLSDVELLIKQRNGIKAQIIELQEEIDEQNKVKVKELDMKKSKIKYKEAESYVVACNNIVEQLGPKGFQGDIIKKSLAPIKNSIQKNLQLMGIPYEFYFQCESEKGKEIFRFGWINEGVTISYNALSNGEKVFLMAAFITAIVENTNPELKILALDNVDRLDTQSFIKLIKGLSQMNYDNIIVCGVIKNEIKDEILGFTVNNLSHQKIKQQIDIIEEEAI